MGVMISRLAPKYSTFLILGFSVMVFSLFFLTAGRDSMIAIWANKLFDGETDQGIFKAAQTTDNVIKDFLKTFLFVGLSFIKLGIGLAIFTIVKNLRGAGRAMHDAYGNARVAGVEEARFEEPWYGRWFPRFLVLGIGIVLLALALTLWWNANTVFLQRAQFAGLTSGAGWQSYVVIDRVLSPVIAGVKFLGEGLMVVGIATGLAAIITNLSFQAKALPWLTRRAMGQTSGELPVEAPRPVFPWPLVALAISGATVLALSLPLGMVQAGFGAWAQHRQFDGAASSVALRTEGILDRGIDGSIVMGLALLFAAIAFLLLTIIRHLRQQREEFGDAVADLSGGVLTRPGVEPSLWPQRLVAPLAVAGVVIVAFFFFTMTAVRNVNFDHLLTLQLAGSTDTVAFQNATRLDTILDVVNSTVRFIGIAALMLAIGLALVTIVVHLRAMGMLLPTGFSKLIPRARGEQIEAEDMTVDRPMALAPWDLLRPHLLGVAMLITASLPIGILLAISTHRTLEEQFAGFGAAGNVSGLFKSSFLSMQLFDASLAPWMLFGMGLVLFAIGRFFSTIVGFVEARRMVIEESTEAIAEAVAGRLDTEAAPAGR